MAGLREMKKKNTRKAILEYAGNKFKEEGYEKVKTSEVAKAVGIGEGTLFNYFNTKGQLFMESVFGDFEAVKYSSQLDKISTETELVNELVYVLDCYLKSIFKINKSLLVEFLSVLYSSNNGGISVSDKNLLYFDELMIRDIEGIIDNLEIDDANLDINTVTMCILSCVIMQFTLFVYDDHLTYEKVISTIRQQVQVIIKGNITFK